jgi:hypothetical protein
MKKITIQHFGLNELTSMELNQINGGDNITQKIFNWFGQLYAHYQNGQELIGRNYGKYGGPCMV